VADHILRRSSVLDDVVHHADERHLLEILDEQVLAPAERLHSALRHGASENGRALSAPLAPGERLRNLRSRRLAPFLQPDCAVATDMLFGWV
jgi:hypothetical protein